MIHFILIILKIIIPLCSSHYNNPGQKMDGALEYHTPGQVSVAKPPGRCEEIREHGGNLCRHGGILNPSFLFSGGWSVGQDCQSPIIQYISNSFKR